jgi:hypothetical protein
MDSNLEVYKTFEISWKYSQIIDDIEIDGVEEEEQLILLMSDLNFIGVVPIKDGYLQTNDIILFTFKPLAD